jgi:hypothetical protein
MSSQDDQDKISNDIDKESSSDAPDERNKGGRFLKRTESGNNWIEVKKAEAMEKASHALRGMLEESKVG